MIFIRKSSIPLWLKFFERVYENKFGWELPFWTTMCKCNRFKLKRIIREREKREKIRDWEKERERWEGNGE